MVTGYKCFQKGLINQYGKQFEVGKTYHNEEDIKFQKSGFHMCANLEDTLRYFDTYNEEVDIAKVVGFGNIDEYYDDYNEFYDMYAVEYLKIERVLSREEIIEYGLNLPFLRAKRFLSLYKLTKEELALFRDKFIKERMLQDTMDYYQDENSKKYIKR